KPAGRSTFTRVPSADMTTTEEEGVMINELLSLLRVSEEWMAAKASTVENGSSLAGDDARTEPYHLSHGVVQSITIAVDHLHCFQQEVVGQLRPGVSSVIITAPTNYVLSGSRGAVALIGAALRLVEQRSASHL